ncbi:Protein WHAT'S THIS FACTOR 1 homolog, chloroplastic [Linum grandiflorum]
MHRRQSSLLSYLCSKTYETAFPFQNSGSILVSRRQIASGGRRPKKKIYNRDNDLDKVMDLQKKPSVILQVGGGSDKNPPSVTLTERAAKIAGEESEARALMEPTLIRNLRKLLMMSVDCRVLLEKDELIENELGLPPDFKESLIPKYPKFFSVKDDVKGKPCLHLEHWDSSLAMTVREEKMDLDGVPFSNPSRKVVRISKDGNYVGPFAFKMHFAAGFRPNNSFLEELERWQRLDFPSPYLNPRTFEAADPKARKCVVSVLHELLSLTMEKRLTSSQLDAFHSEYLFLSRLLLCLIKHHGIFYITNKGARSTVFLKEAYDGTNLITKCPLMSLNDKFVALSGRRALNSGNQTHSLMGS